MGRIAGHAAVPANSRPLGQKPQSYESSYDDGIGGPHGYGS